MRREELTEGAYRVTWPDNPPETILIDAYGDAYRAGPGASWAVSSTEGLFTDCTFERLAPCPVLTEEELVRCIRFTYGPSLEPSVDASTSVRSVNDLLKSKWSAK